jgi:hypothetical protein
VGDHHAQERVYREGQEATSLVSAFSLSISISTSLMVQGTPAHAGVCLRQGALPGVWARDAAEHRRPHPGRGHPHDAAPSQACHRPAADRPGAGLPRHLRVGLVLTTQRLFPRPSGRSGPRCVRAASRWPRVASTSACVTSLGADRGVCRVRRVVCAPTEVSRGVCAGCGRWVSATQNVL